MGSFWAPPGHVLCQEWLPAPTDNTTAFRENAVPIPSLPRAKTGTSLECCPFFSKKNKKIPGRHSRDGLAHLHPQDSSEIRMCLQETAGLSRRAGHSVTGTRAGRAWGSVSQASGRPGVGAWGQGGWLPESPAAKPATTKSGLFTQTKSSFHNVAFSMRSSL